MFSWPSETVTFGPVIQAAQAKNVKKATLGYPLGGFFVLDESVAGVTIRNCPNRGSKAGREKEKCGLRLYPLTTHDVIPGLCQVPETIYCGTHPTKRRNKFAEGEVCEETTNNVFKGVRVAICQRVTK